MRGVKRLAKRKTVTIDMLDATKKAFSESKKRNFSESVEIAINLKDVDLKNPKNKIEDEVVLPKGRGKACKVCVIGGGELAIKAKNVADHVITPEDMDELAKSKKELKKIINGMGFFIAEAPLMPTIGKKFGRIMAPRGKMPKPIPPSADPSGLIKNLRHTVRIRTKKSRTFHVLVGTKDMSPEDVIVNIDAVMKRIITKLDRGRQNIDSVFVKSTMGKAERIM